MDEEWVKWLVTICDGLTKAHSTYMDATHVERSIGCRAVLI